MQLRGRYLSYPKASRDVDFDRDNKSYTQHFTANGLPKRSNETDFDEIPLKDPIKLSETDKLSAALKVGDEATFANPFVTDNPAFEHENVIYLGNLQFMGHPFGTFTLSEYAANLTRYASKDTPDDKKGDWCWTMRPSRTFRVRSRNSSVVPTMIRSTFARSRRDAQNTPATLTDQARQVIRPSRSHRTLWDHSATPKPISHRQGRRSPGAHNRNL